MAYIEINEEELYRDLAELNLRKTFNEEFGYLCHKYFGRAKVEPYQSNYHDIVMYIDGVEYYHGVLNNHVEFIAPNVEDILIGDFNDIYVLSVTEPEAFTFRVISKKDGIIRTKDYNFSYDKGHIRTVLAINEIEDYNNELNELYEESNLPMERFIVTNYFEKIEDTNEIICSSILNGKKVNNFVTSFTNLDDCLDEIEDARKNRKFQSLDRNKQLLMEMNEQLTSNKIKMKRK